MSKVIVAIDGPAGSGKSSVSKQVAREFGFAYLDTGAAYRALAWATLNGLSFERLVSNNFETDFEYSISTDPDNFWVRVGEHDVTEAIRTSLISETVSSVAALSHVRDFMKRLTKKIVDECPYDGAVVEGRDITTVVFPDAALKVFLTASAARRADRRHKQLISKGIQARLADLRADLERRDEQDRVRSASPLKPAEDALALDNSDMGIDESVDLVLEWWSQRRPF